MSIKNNVSLIGNVGRVEKTSAGGKVVLNFSVAINEQRKGEDGEKSKDTNWYSLSVWEDRAESLSKVLEVGQLVCVQGRLSSKKEKDYKLSILVDRVEVLKFNPKEETAE